MNILFIGPMTPPIHGQSIAFEEIYKNTNSKKYLVNQNFENKPILSKIFFTFIAMLKTTKYILFNKIDIIYFTSTRSFLGSFKDIYLLLLCKIFNKKIINHLHGADLINFYNSLPVWYKKIVYILYLKINIAIVLLPQTKNQFTEIWSEMHVEVVPNFYSDDLFYSPSLKSSNKVTRILYLSNILTSKGIFDLLDAVKTLNTSAYKLSIAGDFMEDEYMSKSEIKEKFLNEIKNIKQIQYVGVVRGISKKNLLQKSDIFVLPTYYKTEAFPISILEAMATGNAIITTRHNYMSEVIDEKNGHLVKINSAEEIADVLKYLLTHKKELQSIQKYNAEVSSKRYTTQNYINNINRIFQKLYTAK